MAESPFIEPQEDRIHMEKGWLDDDDSDAKFMMSLGLLLVCMGFAIFLILAGSAIVASQW